MVVSNQVDEIKEIVAAAQSAVAEVKDTDLRLAAFNRVLEHLLTGEPVKARKPSPKRRRSASIKDPAKKTKRAVTGPKGRIEELIGDGFFNEPKSSADILKALGERGHHMKLSDITYPLQALTREKQLRRDKSEPPGGGKEVWHYSNW